MKCALCHRALEGIGLVVCTFNETRTFTATVHRDCLGDEIGAGNVRKINRLAIDTGWEQQELPGFTEGARLRPLS